MHRRTLRHIAFMLFALCAATSLFGLGTDVRVQASRQKKAPATKAEAFVLNQFKAGRKADFTDSSLWTPEERRVIGADFLKRLLTNSVEGLKSGPKGVFIKGAVVTQPELSRFAAVETADARGWTRARYTITVEVQPIDGVSANVSVNAKIEGRTDGASGGEWITLPSNGTAEQEFLSALVESLGGTPSAKP